MRDVSGGGIPVSIASVIRALATHENVRAAVFRLAYGRRHNTPTQEETMADRSEADVMRRVAWRLVPFLGLGYYVNALDRSNIAVAALTMNRSLGFTAAEYGLGAGAFFWSYILFQVPSNVLLARFGARRWL